MKKWFKKELAVILAIALILPSLVTTAVQTHDSNTPKEETVYANLNADGSVTGVYVVNGFQNTGDGKIEDYGEYSSVRNMSTDEPIRMKDGKITAKTKNDKFYYEGVLKTVQLPWTIQIDYNLNGIPCRAEQLRGASGNLVMGIHVGQNAQVDETFFKNYALQITAAFRDDLCDSISADGATRVDAAGKSQLIFTALPGQGGNFTVSAHVHDFEMDSISLNGIRMNLNTGLLNTNDITEPLSQLKSGIDAFSQGTNQLQKGTNSLASGVNALASGAGTVSDGMNSLSSQSGSLVNGSAQISQGIGSIREALNQFNIPMEKIQELVEGSNQAKTGIEKLVDGICQLQTAIQQYRQQLEEAGINPDTILDNDEAAIPTLRSAGLNNIADLMEQNMALIMADQLLIGASERGVSALAAGGTTLKNQYALLNAAIAQIPAMMEDMNTKLLQLKAGINQLYQSSSQLSGGLSQYSSGFSELTNGYSSLYSGFNQLQQGASQLQKGSAQLNGGAQEMQSQTNGMSDKVASTLSSAEGILGSANFMPTSFVSTNNSSVDSVQFLMTTKEIKKREETHSQKTEEKKLSFWQKFLHIFGWHSSDK